MDDYTPALPPGFTKASPPADEKESNNEDVKRIGPIGPALPLGLKLNTDKSDTEDSSASSSDSENESSTSRGPTGPGPGPSFIGPYIPGGYTAPQADNDEDEDDSDVIGPTPHSGPVVKVSATEEFEQRAQRMRDKLLKKDDDEAPIAREDWMMTLPEKMKKSIGVEAKSSFSRSRCTGEIDSTWTETPAEKEKREQEERAGKKISSKRKYEELVPSARDQEMQSKVDDYNKKNKREKSLLELHQKKVDKKKKKEKKKEKKKRKKMEKEGKSYKEERVPFDRERDLKTGHFDEAMKRNMLKRARGLGGKFETGGTTNKFL